MTSDREELFHGYTRASLVFLARDAASRDRSSVAVGRAVRASSGAYASFPLPQRRGQEALGEIIAMAIQ